MKNMKNKTLIILCVFLGFLPETNLFAQEQNIDLGTSSFFSNIEHSFVLKGKDGRDSVLVLGNKFEKITLVVGKTGQKCEFNKRVVSWKNNSGAHTEYDYTPLYNSNKIILAKDSLPIIATVESKDYLRIESFNNQNESHLKSLRSIIKHKFSMFDNKSAYKDTITIIGMDTIKVQMELSNKNWKSEVLYVILKDSTLFKEVELSSIRSDPNKWIVPSDLPVGNYKILIKAKFIHDDYDYCDELSNSQVIQIRKVADDNNILCFLQEHSEWIIGGILGALVIISFVCKKKHKQEADGGLISRTKGFVCRIVRLGKKTSSKSVLKKEILKFKEKEKQYVSQIEELEYLNNLQKENVATLEAQLTESQSELQGTHDKINDAEGRVIEWQKKSVEAERARDDIKNKLRELNTKAQKQIFDLNHNFKDLTAEIQKLNKEKSIQVRKVEALTGHLATKDNIIKEVSAEKDKLINQQMQFQVQLNKTEKRFEQISKQQYLITKIDTTLCVVCSELRTAFANVSSEQMMKRIVNPLMSGIGLDNGVESYYEQWESHVLNDIKGYFGVDSIYDLKDEELAAKLTSGFLKEIAKTDSFSKLTRLYLYAQVDWIHPQLISMGFDICAIEDAFMRMKALFADYNIILIYPELFVDEMDDTKFMFNAKCDVFDLFTPDEQTRRLYTNSSLIADVLQVGISIAPDHYNRKAIVSIPNI